VRSGKLSDKDDALLMATVLQPPGSTRSLCRTARSETTGSLHRRPIQLIDEIRQPIPAKLGQIERFDCE
jgi:hypothetical protein